jgi:hypothetical protein
LGMGGFQRDEMRMGRADNSESIVWVLCIWKLRRLEPLSSSPEAREVSHEKQLRSPDDPVGYACHCL